MDRVVEILLGSYKNSKSIDVDNFERVALFNNTSELTEYDVYSKLSSSEVIDEEREANPNYRIYGRIEYMSMLNGLKNNYTSFKDFYSPQNSSSYNILNSFDFYLVKPAVSGYTKITGSTTTSSSGGVIAYYILDEKFDNWVSASPTDYPLGWQASASIDSYLEQTPSNQAKFYFDNQFIFGTPSNIIGMGIDVSSASGEIIIETNISTTAYDSNTDSMSVLLTSNGHLVKSVNLFSGGTGYKKLKVDIPVASGITRVGIIGNSSNKAIYLDYLKVYKTGGTNTITTTTTTGVNNYIRYFEVIATPRDFELYPVGYSNNVYGEQTYAFSFNRDFDVSQYFDNFGFPLTELFLFPYYIKKTNGNNVTEVMSGTTWNVDGTVNKFLFPSVPVITLNYGDYVKISTGTRIGDLIEYDKGEFVQTQVMPQTFYIKTQCKDEDNQSINLIWKYNPFIPFRLRYFANELNAVNSGSTSYDDLISKPDYATLIDNDGNYVWRDILPQGYKDPLTGIGVDYPFLNKRRYLFSQIVFSIVPDLSDYYTSKTFSKIWFSRYATNLDVNMDTSDDLKNAGKPCGK